MNFPYKDPALVGGEEVREGGGVLRKRTHRRRVVLGAKFGKLKRSDGDKSSPRKDKDPPWVEREEVGKGAGISKGGSGTTAATPPCRHSPGEHLHSSHLDLGSLVILSCEVGMFSRIRFGRFADRLGLIGS